MVTAPAGLDAAIRTLLIYAPDGARIRHRVICVHGLIEGQIPDKKRRPSLRTFVVNSMD
jgi:hypothetical protein